MAAGMPNKPANARLNNRPFALNALDRPDFLSTIMNFIKIRYYISLVSFLIRLNFVSRSKRPDQLLAASKGPLKQLFRHAQSLLAMQRLIQKLTPGELQVISFEDQVLSLNTPSAALATRIKYSQNSLIASLARLKRPVIVTSIKVQVRPDLIEAYKPKAPANFARPPSAENGRHLAEAAKYIEDEALRKALIQLSTRAAPED